MNVEKKHVVIVGAGFGGLAAAKRLAKNKYLAVTMIDYKNHHLFQPLLYQVAMAGLSPAEIAVPIRSVLSRYHHNVEVLMGCAQNVDLVEKKISLPEHDDISYDYLLLACGASHSYFGHEEWEPHAPGLKTIEQATEIRRRVLQAFENAEKEKDKNLQKEFLTFVVVGGGPTGVELAGALGEISRYTLSRDFVHIDPRRTRIILIEGGPRILPSFNETISRKAARDLEELGVTVWTSTLVTDIDAEGVSLGEETLKARTVLWAAGVKPSSLNQKLGVPLDNRGGVIIEKDLSLKTYPEVFVIGDQASFKDDQGNTLPGLAPVAIQQGHHVAKNILRLANSKSTLAFRYFDKGQMATVGRKKAVVQVGNFRMTGLLAWYVWLFVHIYYLVGFRNRVFVFLQWAWSYLFYSRGARLIVSKDWQNKC